jgi:nitroimidazol reductase NimA-like FMN-containing flavoprotein (pyridoxamine 5'-phosphate oxidase superfamily)
MNTLERNLKMEHIIRDLNQKQCATLLANNYFGYLGYIYNGSPYIVPMTYFFDGKNTIVVYASEGHKTMAMRKNNRVSLKISESKNSNNWTSVLVHGIFEELSGIDAKRSLHEYARGIKEIILEKEEKNLHFIHEFCPKRYNDKTPVIFKITIDEMTGKNSDFYTKKAT